MNSNRLNIRIISIFAIIIAAFLGSAVFFLYLNTDSIKQSMETETRLSSVILSSEIRSGIPENPAASPGEMPSSAADTGMQPAQSLDSNLSEQLTEAISRANHEVGENVDIWVVDGSRGVLYENVSEGGEPLDALLSDAQWKEMQASLASQEDVDSSVLLWSGNQGPLMLDQQLLMVRPIYSDSLYLVMCNRGTTNHAMQRRQLVLFAVVEIILLIAMIMVLANTLFRYRKQLIQLATKDELTGLSNRKSFNEAYGDYIKKDSAPDQKELFTVFLVDTDYFKQINDTYGHAAGDQALRAVADQISRMTESCGGFAGRWGGDEFIGVMPLCGEEAIQKIRALCENIRTIPMEEGFRITISAGAAEADRAKAPKLANLTEMADLALYVSKENGRDRATLYSVELAAVTDQPLVQQEMENEASKPAVAAAEKVPQSAAETPGAVRSSPEASKGKPVRGRLKTFLREKLVASILTGVKWMAPFVAGGGLLIGLAFLFDAWSVDLTALSVGERAQLGSITPVAAILKNIGDSTFNFMLPVFAGFMAYGLAGESAFLAGFMGGFMTIQSNAGFIGAMIAGLVAGLIVFQINEFIGRTPRFVQKAAPIVIYPVLSLLLMHVVASLIITPVASSIGHVFTRLLDVLNASNGNLAGTVAGGMMAVDMGGIINKVAYTYGVSGLAVGGTGFMASVMAGGMVPPIGIAISMLLFKKKYTLQERERTAGTLFMGLSFITEGALPFVFSDVLRVIPCCIVGSALSGLLSALFGCQLPAPHGGIFVLPVMVNPLLYLLAILAGSFVTALLLGCFKKSRDGSEEKP